ncbi:hypothetical protein AAD018_018355 [Aestuariibius insulae]|uniref:hypothetical protein n=1 Tax=Aestuariibius insulae TaxID=2058287 RepID=UPI00345E8B7F
MKIDAETSARIAELEKTQLLRLRGSWPWIVADRTGDFDAVIGRPMTKWDAIRQRTKDYIASVRRIPPDAPSQDAADLTRDLLLRLASDGEDVSRMLLWAMHLEAYILPGGRPECWGGAPADWDEAIYSWKNIPEGELHRQLYDSFKVEVLEPQKRVDAIWKETTGHDDAWCEDPSLRTEWDEVLWDWKLGSIWIEPAHYIQPGYERVLRREWWRRWRERLGPEEAARIGAPLPSGRNVLLSLDEVTAVDLLPPFHEVANLSQEQI